MLLLSLHFGGDGLLCEEAHRSLMKSKPLAFSLPHLTTYSYSSLLMAFPLANTLPSQIQEPDDLICSDQNQPAIPPEQQCSVSPPSPSRCLTEVSPVERAWAHWTKLGRPKFLVAPMVDNSELPFRMLCRKYGAQAAYTPMLHSRIFTETEKYRKEEFTTCQVI